MCVSCLWRARAQVGNLANPTEDRSHFGAWVIVSAPLILGFQLTDEATMDRVWPVVSNTEAIAISQTWAGHPGRLVTNYNDRASVLPHDAAATCDNTTFPFDYGGKQAWGLTQDKAAKTWQDCEQACCADSGCTIWQWGGPTPHQCFIGAAKYFTDNKQWFASRGKAKPPPPPPGSNTVQLWAKPLHNGVYAAFALSNDATASRSVQISFTDVFNASMTSAKVAVRDVWQHKDLGTFAGSYTTDAIGPHDSRMYTFTPATEE